MNRLGKIILYNLILILVFQTVMNAETHEVYSFSSTESIPMGIGGAVSARLGGIENVFYNPATISRYKEKFWDSKLRFSFHFNPSAIISYSKYGIKNKTVDGFPDVDAPLFIIRGISIHKKPFSTGLIFGEEVLDNYTQADKDWFDIRDVPANRRSATYINIMLAQRVRIGATLTAYIVNRKYLIENLAASYGVYLEPSKFIHVGVFFADHPEFSKESAEIYDNNVRRVYSGIEDQSVNIGVEINPVENITFDVDARNVFREEENTNLELRFGSEITLFRQLALRSGIIPRTDSGDHYYTCGFGILDTNSFRKTPGIYETPSFAINYAFVYRGGDSTTLRTHLLTLVLEI